MTSKKITRNRGPHRRTALIRAAILELSGEFRADRIIARIEENSPGLISINYDAPHHGITQVLKKMEKDGLNVWSRIMPVFRDKYIWSINTPKPVPVPVPAAIPFLPVPSSTPAPTQLDRIEGYLLALLTNLGVDATSTRIS